MQRRRVEVRGFVQGVGFRPFVHGLAQALELAGRVWNHAAGAAIEVEGPAAALDQFVERLRSELPAPGRIDQLDVQAVPLTGETGFTIVASRTDGEPVALVLADLAMCDACRAEIIDPADRRYRYPFTNCTHCGPRFTILAETPYDRAATTMAGFLMCAACQAEYDDPTDRRFHAQPNACRECGPQVRLVRATGEDLPGEPLATAASALRDGAILAVKGLGGYHLAVDAANHQAVERLRTRKHRDAKPFAVMARKVDTAATLGQVNEAEAALLMSPAAPIVLLTRHEAAPLAPGVAPGMTTVGVILAYTPLHHLLLRAFGGPLVMTSGNVSDEPQAYDDDDAFARLSGLADAFLTHDRPIQRRCDDSVARVWRHGDADRTLWLRRSRGVVPTPLELDVPDGEPVLAVGGHQKNTFCLLRGRQALLSHHLGDLENDLALDAFEQGIADFERLFRAAPTAIACDLHPDYLATQYARRRAEALGLPLVEVQHHHAHLVSCLADNGRTEPALGVILDGTGLGPDGTIWGGELLLGDAAGYQRVGRLRPFVLPGGSAAVRQGWRVALALAQQAEGRLTAADLGVDRETFQAVGAILADGRHCPVTTSAGRLFDAFAALAGVTAESRYEGEAAVLLEAACQPESQRVMPFEVGLGDEGLLELDWRPAVAAAVDMCQSGAHPGVVAMRFHRGLAAGLADWVGRAGELSGRRAVALSGGCFQNMTLLSLLSGTLRERGLDVLVHDRVPPNDGGLSLGQAVVGRAWQVAPAMHPGEG